MNEMVKVLYIIPAEGFGGAERQAIFHISNLPDEGVEVTVVTGPGLKVKNALKDCDADIRYCASLPGEYARPFNIFSYSIYAVKTLFSWIRSLVFLKRLVAAEHFDVIVACRVVGLTFAGPLSHKFKIPYIWRFGSCVHGSLRSRALRLFGNAYPPAAIVANCQAVGESLRPLINAPQTIVPNGLHPKFYCEIIENRLVHEKLNLPVDMPVVGLAVRPSPDKGMDFLKEIVKFVNVPEKRIHFCIAGEFGWRMKIQKEFEEAGLASSVTFLGHIEDIKEFYLGCDIVILTSRNKSIEGFPNSLLEAMALGRPVVATDAGGVSELIDNNDLGIVIHDGSAETFGKELLNLALDKSLRNKIGSCAAAVVRERYSSRVVIKKLADTIRGCIPDK